MERSERSFARLFLMPARWRRRPTNYSSNRSAACARRPSPWPIPAQWLAQGGSALFVLACGFLRLIQRAQHQPSPAARASSVRAGGLGAVRRRNFSRREMRWRLGLILLFSGGLVNAVAAQTSGTQMVIIVVPGLRADDLARPELPTLRRIVARSAFGWMNTRTARIAGQSDPHDPEEAAY